MEVEVSSLLKLNVARAHPDHKRRGASRAIRCGTGCAAQLFDNRLHGNPAGRGAQSVHSQHGQELSFSSKMESLEWRTKQLENKIVSSNILSEDGPTICDRLVEVAQMYKKFTQEYGDLHIKFKNLYKSIGDISTSLDIDDDSKASLVLLYEDDLIKHFEMLKTISEKADKILDIKQWPDTSRVDLSNLETITRSQHLETVVLDKQLEELIDIYNDIISSFKENTIIWNQKLEAYENEDKLADEDV